MGVAHPNDIVPVGRRRPLRHDPSGGCYTVTLSSNAYQYVNRLETTQFRLPFQKDDDDDPGNDYIKFYTGNYATTASRPALIIKYYVP